MPYEVSGGCKLRIDSSRSRAARLKKADALIEEHVGRFLEEAPKVAYRIASKREIHAWRRRMLAGAARDL